MFRRPLPLLFVISLSVSCGAPPAGAPRTLPDAARADPVVISVVGTSDLHGHVDHLPWLGGYLTNLRRARASDGGVLLLDAGDMFQGTLASNLNEGQSVVAAYNVLRYDAAVVGNHEFDYGPVGPSPIPRQAGDDPLGALRARAAEAEFPLLAANLVRRSDGAPLPIANVHPSVTLDVAGVRTAVIGVTTRRTLYSTRGENVAGLELLPLADAVARHSAAARDAGAELVVLAAHAGGACTEFDDPDDLGSCDDRAEIFELVRALPGGAVDAVLAGHTHAGVAHRVRGIPVIQGYANGRAFSRVDLHYSPAERRVVAMEIHPPREICAERGSACEAGTYAGAPVEPDASVAQGLEPALRRAAEVGERPLGVRLIEAIPTSRDRESPLGNLAAELMLAAVPGAEVALLNSSAIRADLPPGDLTYRAFYEANPFDNELVTLDITGAALREIVSINLVSDGSILALAGVLVRASCRGERLAVELLDAAGAPIADGRTLRLVTIDFIASGGNRILSRGDAEPTGLDQRDAMVGAFVSRFGDRKPLRASDLFDPSAPRWSYQGERPLDCR